MAGSCALVQDPECTTSWDGEEAGKFERFGNSGGLRTTVLQMRWLGDAVWMESPRSEVESSSERAPGGRRGSVADAKCHEKLRRDTCRWSGLG